MSKRLRLLDEIQSLEGEGLVAIDGDEMTILRDHDKVRERILLTGPWGALLLMGVCF